MNNVENFDGRNSKAVSCWHLSRIFEPKNVLRIFRSPSGFKICGDLVTLFLFLFTLRFHSQFSKITVYVTFSRKHFAIVSQFWILSQKEKVFLFWFVKQVQWKPSDNFNRRSRICEKLALTYATLNSYNFFAKTEKMSVSNFYFSWVSVLIFTQNHLAVNLNKVLSFSRLNEAYFSNF